MPGRFGVQGYALALAALPGDTEQIARRCGYKLESVTSLMRRLWSLGLVHPGQSVIYRGRPRAVWCMGEGEAAEGLEVKRLRPGANHIMFAAMVRAMQRGGTTLDIAEDSGCVLQVAQYFVRAAHGAGLCHIGDWTRTNPSNRVAVYEWGKGKDVAKPPAMNNQQKWLRYKSRDAGRAMTFATAGA